MSLLHKPTVKKMRQDDSWDRAAEIELRLGGRYGGTGFIEGVKESCKELNLDGCLMNYMFSCNAGRSLVFATKDVLEKEQDCPTLVLEFDYMDKRDYNTESARTRIEAFAELLKSRPQRRKPTVEEMLNYYRKMGCGDRHYKPGTLQEAA